MNKIFIMLIAGILLIACETKQEKKTDFYVPTQEEKEGKKEKEEPVVSEYIDNALQTGDTPYTSCFGGNESCNRRGCSKIEVIAPLSSDVVVTIKKNDNVVRHAYIRERGTYAFELPNGIYQTFFYYGKGWDPNKKIKSSNCEELKGGFVSKESFSKDEAQLLDNNILTYELILQENGNLRTQSSNSEEAF